MITVLYPARGGGQGRAELTYEPGKSVRRYLRDSKLMQQGLVGRAEHCRILNQRGERLRLNSMTLKMNDTIKLVLVSRGP